MLDTVTLVAEVVGVVLLLAAVPVIWIIVRRRWLASRGQVFDCALRLPDAPAVSGWMLGAARYRGDAVEWYRTFSLSWRARVVLPRGGTAVRRVREPEAAEVEALYADQLVAELATPRPGMELAMGRGEMTAFLSWTEAAPPGQPA